MTTLRPSVSIDPGGLAAPIRPSPLAVARIRRRLTVEETAARAHLDVDQIKSPEEQDLAPQPAAAPVSLAERWEIQVDVFNGTPTGNAAAGIANKIAGLAYRIGAVADASRPDYTRTLVYYPPGAGAIAKRLARELGVGTATLPGGDNPRRLVVIVGARQGRRS
jgi:hypothetical protein